MLVCTDVYNLCNTATISKNLQQTPPLFCWLDSPTRIQKTDIGEPVLVQDPEAGETVAESELNQSNEMLIN